MPDFRRMKVVGERVKSLRERQKDVESRLVKQRRKKEEKKAKGTRY